MGRGIRTSAAFAAAALVLAACGGGSDDDNGGGGGSADSGNIDRSASVTYASSVGPSSLDPHGPPSQGIGGAQYYNPVFDRLTYIGTPEDPNSTEISPMLAESWEFSEDGLALTLQLRDDITFHDGSPVNADAVKASLERAKQSTYNAGSYLRSVASVDVVDEFTVRLNLSAPDSALPAILGTASGVVINPAVINDPSVDLNLSVPEAAGSGPYVVSDFVPGTSVTYTRADDDYWDPDAARIEEIQFVGVAEATTRISGVQAGDYDLIFLGSLQVPEGERLAQGGQFTNYTATSRTPTYLYLRPTSPGLDDPLVRQAIAHAIDRDGIAEGALNGTCEPTEQLYPEGSPGYDADYENPYSYDPDEARALLEEAGVSDVSFEAVFPVGGTQDAIATALQAQLEEVGIEMVATGVPPAESITVFNQRNLPATVNATTGEADPAIFTDSVLFSRTPVGAGDTELTSLAAEGRTETDAAARDDIYQQINERAMEEALLVPICVAQFAYTGAPNLVDVDRLGLTFAASADLRYVGVTE